MKTCSKCKELKEEALFSMNKASKDGLNCYCRSCHAFITKTYKDVHKETMRASAKKSRVKRKIKIREYDLVKNYGCSLEQYNSMFTAQNGICPGCTRHQSEFTYALCVDHCHTTGKIRGLLCKDCNLVLGRALDKKQTLINLSHYLDHNLSNPIKLLKLQGNS